MNLVEVIALVGAAAWIPHLAQWIYGLVVVPALKIFPDQVVIVGFHSGGPRVSVRLAFSAERRAAIIDNLELNVRHSDGDTHDFRWSSIEETFSQIKDQAGNWQIVGNQQTPIAIKIWVDWIVDKFVHFIEPTAIDAVSSAITKFDDQFNHWQRIKEKDYIAKALASKELHDVIQTRENSFWWKPGRYEVRVRLSSPKSFRFKAATYTFELTPRDIERLKENIPAIKEEWEDYVHSFAAGHTRKQRAAWNWVNAKLTVVR